MSRDNSAVAYKKNLTLVSLTRPFEESQGFVFEWRHPKYGSVYVAWNTLPKHKDILGIVPFQMLPWFSARSDDYYAYVSQDSPFQMPCRALVAAIELTRDFIAHNGCPVAPAVQPTEALRDREVIAELKTGT